MNLLLRLIALAALATSWALIVHVVVGGAIWLLAHNPWWHLTLPTQWEAAGWSGLVGLACASLAVVSHWMTPLKSRLKILGPAPVRPPRELKHEVRELATKARMATPKVWVIPHRGIQAYALAAPGRRAIAITSGALSTLSGPERRWVLAHEIGHIRYRDAQSLAWWIGVQHLTQKSLAIRARIFAGIARGLIRSRLLRPIGFLVDLIGWLLDRLTRLVLWPVKGVWRLGIKMMRRHQEFRADRFAVDLVGARPGIVALSRLGGGWESPIRQMFRTHPSTRRRIAAIRRMGACNFSRPGTVKSGT